MKQLKSCPVVLALSLIPADHQEMLVADILHLTGFCMGALHVLNSFLGLLLTLCRTKDLSICRN